jgi:hypothetical protein
MLTALQHAVPAAGRDEPDGQITDRRNFAASNVKEQHP